MIKRKTLAVIAGIAAAAVVTASGWAAYAARPIRTVTHTVTITKTTPPKIKIVTKTKTVTVTKIVPAVPSGDGQIACVLDTITGILMPLNAGGAAQAVAAGEARDETCSVGLFTPPGVPNAAGEAGMSLTDAHGTVSNWLVSPAS